MAEPDSDIIDEDPMTMRELNDHMRQFFNRRDVRQFLYMVRCADLSVFLDEPLERKPDSC